MTATLIVSHDELNRHAALIDPIVAQRPAEPVIDGLWYEDRFHNGHSAYHLHRDPSGTWVLVRSVRNACLDGVTDEDVEAGCLDDDQLQALADTTLEEAQNMIWRQVVGLAIGVGPDVHEESVVVALFKAAVEEGAPCPTEDLDLGIWPGVAS